MHFFVQFVYDGKKMLDIMHHQGWDKSIPVGKSLFTHLIQSCVKETFQLTLKFSYMYAYFVPFKTCMNFTMSIYLLIQSNSWSFVHAKFHSLTVFRLQLKLSSFKTPLFLKIVNFLKASIVLFLAKIYTCLRKLNIIDSISH